MVHKSQLSDPFAFALAPPANETAEAKQERVERETEEKRVSDQIDEELKKDRAEEKKRSKREVKVLLLGQAESGKSTVLKNFRLKYAPSQWKAELCLWRAVIQLNLVQNVIVLLDVLQDRLALSESEIPAPATATPPTVLSYLSGGRGSLDSTLTDMSYATARESTAVVVLSQKHHDLNLRLSPLRKVADDLRKRLSADDPEFAFANEEDASATYGPLDAGSEDAGETVRRRGVSREFGVRGWISALGFPANGISNKSNEPMAVDEPTEILATLRDDIMSLSKDADVSELLRLRGLRIEDRPGYFLSDIARITNRSYLPSDNDVVRARLRTLGVQEWRILLENNGAFGSEWVIYDVGGSRSMRHAWLPYFDAVNAIIFLAPISCFDERLAEDSSVNRLQDTLLLWKAIVSSKLLGKITLIVFLNKCDLLKRKLQHGIMVNKHLISFGKRENEVGVVVKYLKDKFKDIIRLEASTPRTTYIYATSVTDTKATAATLNIVRDSIIREHLKHAEFV